MVLDILVQSRRDKGCGQALLPPAAQGGGRSAAGSRTDKLRSYGVAHREVMPLWEYRSPKGMTDRAENSHQPTRQRERVMKGFPQHRRRSGVPVCVQRHLTPASGPAAT
ncbi:hypothetical protein [Streptomyces acidiscabies]|uniref:hypothetical protein n=1 Tax=Streptomyces acidiscabies TaxID=42234 RepID=UPI0038F7E356